MEEGVFPEGLRIVKDQETGPEYSWGDHESVAERVLFNIDRLSQFQSPIARGDAHLWWKLLDRDYEGVRGLAVGDYNDPEHPASKDVMAVAIAKDKNDEIYVFAIANIRNILGRGDDFMLFALAEEASHIRDLLKIKSIEGKFRNMTGDEHRDSEVRARLHQIALYEEIRREGVRNNELDNLLKRMKPGIVDLIKQLAGVKISDTQKKKQEYDRVLTYLREINYKI